MNNINNQNSINDISLKLETIKNFTKNVYDNILNYYNEIISMNKSKGNNKSIKKRKSKNFQNNNDKNINNNDSENENIIKEMLVEIEKIFNNFVEYVKH